MSEHPRSSFWRNQDESRRSRIRFDLSRESLIAWRSATGTIDVASFAHLLDYMQFEDLVPWCEAAERWEFLVVASPLRIESGTGPPVNPIAIL